MKFGSKRQEERSRQSVKGYSVIDENVIVRGDIETEGTLRIDGRLEGNVIRAASVVVGGTGSVVGEIHAYELVVGGTVNGNIIVDRRVELEASALVVGDITADAVLIHEGGKVRGRLLVRSSDETEVRSSAPLRLPSPTAVEA